VAAEPKRGRGRVRIRRVSDAAIFILLCCWDVLGLWFSGLLLSFPLLMC